MASDLLQTHDRALALASRWIAVHVELERRDLVRDDQTLDRLVELEDDIERSIMALPPGTPNAPAAKGLILGARIEAALTTLREDDRLMCAIIGAVPGGVLA